jgi:hypothetical protein
VGLFLLGYHGFLVIASHFSPCLGLRARVGELETELSSVQGTLATMDNEHSELRVAARLLCDALGVVSPRKSWCVNTSRLPLGRSKPS